MKRAKGHLSPLLRGAWDSGDLPTLDMHQHLHATGTHISLIAHITERELAQSLHRTEAHNGFANRCLWTWVQRNNCLPEGGNLSPNALSAVARELRRAVDWAAATPEILFRRDHPARQLWHDCYPALSQLHPACPGSERSFMATLTVTASMLHSNSWCSWARSAAIASRPRAAPPPSGRPRPSQSKKKTRHGKPI